MIELFSDDNFSQNNVFSCVTVNTDICGAK